MAELIIAALGCPNTLTLSCMNAIKAAKRLYLQTRNHPSSKWILDSEIPFSDMDDLYDSSEDFDALNIAVSERLIESALECDTVFAVIGRSAGSSLLLEITDRARKCGILVSQLCSGGGFEAARGRLPGSLDLSRILITEANALDFDINVKLPICIEEIDTFTRAGEIKLKLLEYYPDEMTAYFCSMNDNGEYAASPIPLYELDRQSEKQYNASTLLIVPAAQFDALDRFSTEDLIYVVDRLRDKDGCPWDRVQTHETLRSALIEESYEVLDAIDRADTDSLCEELGDLLLQIVFHAALEKEKREFNMRDITTGIVEKLIYRHPHVFASVDVDSVDDVLRNWEQLKKKEKHFETQTEIMRAVPRCFPSLMRSLKVQKKAADVGFDWTSPSEALKKVFEEADELLKAIENNTNIEEELGDLLFSCVNVARLLKKEPELVLAEATDKFIDRFYKMEQMIEKSGSKIKYLDIEELNTYWNMAKS